MASTAMFRPFSQGRPDSRGHRDPCDRGGTCVKGLTLAHAAAPREWMPSGLRGNDAMVVSINVQQYENAMGWSAQ
jgi:hypothetical protein